MYTMWLLRGTPKQQQIRGLLSSSSVIHKWSVKVYQADTTVCNLPGSYAHIYVYSIQHIYIHLSCIRMYVDSCWAFSVRVCIWGTVLLSGRSMSLYMHIISVWMRTSSELCEYSELICKLCNTCHLLQLNIMYCMSYTAQHSVHLLHHVAYARSKKSQVQLLI